MCMCQLEINLYNEVTVNTSMKTKYSLSNMGGGGGVQTFDELGVKCWGLILTQHLLEYASLMNLHFNYYYLSAIQYLVHSEITYLCIY